MARTVRRNARAPRSSAASKKTTPLSRGGARRRSLQPKRKVTPPRIIIPNAPPTRPVAAETPPASPTEARRLRWGIPLLLFAVAVLVYADDLALPSGMVFDEAHYVRAGQAYAQGRLVNESWGDPRPVNFEHPPLAKYLIAGGIQAVGDEETGWRTASVLMGSTGVAAAYLLAARLFRSTVAGLLAAAFLLFEPLYFLHARITMLDVFPAAFTLWAFAFGLSPQTGQRLLAGLFLGLAVASKYHAVFLLPIFVLLLFLKGAPASPIRRTAPALLVGAGLPFAVLLLSYVPYYWIWWQQGGVGLVFQEFVLVQVAAFAWDFAANATHDYASPPWEWIPLLRPVWYYVGNHPDGRVSMVYSVPNPALWWAGFVTAVLLPAEPAWRWIKTRARHHLASGALSRLSQQTFQFTQTRAELFACLLVLASYLPWFLLQRITFFYYATYIVPFLGLLLAGIAAAAWQRGGTSRRYALAFLGLVAFFFILWYPLASGAWMAKSHYTALRFVVPWMQTAGV